MGAGAIAKHIAVYAAVVGILATSAQAADPSRGGATAFARVGDVTITQQEYEFAVAQAARAKFYHGRPPEAEVQALRREVGERLVDEVLLREEASRRGIAPDAAAVRKKLDELDARYAKSAQWQAQRADVLPRFEAKFASDSVLAQLESMVRASAQATAAEVDAYYAAHPEKFTEPEQLKASMILLKVDPSSPRSAWDKAHEDASAMLERLRAHEDFAALAREKSQDASAQEGGDLGYLHRGMMPEPVQQALDAAQPGELRGPVTLLEGVAVLRLDARVPSRLQPLADARAGAAEFLRREQADAAWTSLIAALRHARPPVFADATFVPLARSGGASGGRSTR